MKASKLPLPVMLFGIFWTAGITLMAATYLMSPPDSALQGTERYGHTYPGEFRHMLVVTTVELLIFAALLRPWSYRRSWGRAVGTAALLTPWILVWGALGLHAGPTTHTHSLWLFFFWVGLVVAAGRGAVRELIERQRSRRLNSQGNP